MKSLHAAAFLVCGFLCAPGLAQQNTSPAPSEGNQPSEQNTPSQQRIAAARQQIATDPKKVQAYNELALAFIRRSRETADPKYLKDAEEALAQGLKLDPADFQLQRTQVALLLSRHQFAQARELATALHRRTPDDVMTYGYLAEAYIGVGNYPEAETNAQWMMDMRPNNTPALMVGAKLRTLFGEGPGAIEFLNLAYSETSPAEVEELAWIANQIAAIQIDSGQLDVAEQTLAQAEQLFPNYPYTIENLARVRSGQNQPAEAVRLWTKASLVDRDPHILFELANAQDAAGQVKEARATLAEFEKLAIAPETSTDNSKLDLILLYAGSAESAPTALKLAQHEISVRQDVWTLDAYAWALYANGQYQEAAGEVDKAIAVGIESAQIFNHAGHIAQKLNKSAEAQKYFQLSVRSNPSSEFALDARKFVSPDTFAHGEERRVSQVKRASDSSVDSAPNGNSNVTNPSERTTSAVAVRRNASAPAFAPVPEALLTPQPTGTTHIIHSAQSVVARNPKNAAGYAGLGAAYFQRARETGDIGDYQLAEEALNRSLDLVSADFSADAALATMAEVCMGEHRFTDALSYAQKALSLGTGDVSPFAIVGDAYADMGEYEKAGSAYARLTPRDMTLSPRAAYARDSRLSYLKFIAGETAAAIALMNTAVAEGVEAQLKSENLAWLYYELGEYETQAGDTASADAAYLAALNIHPGDYRVLAALAKLRANNGRYEEAIVLYQKAIAVVPMPLFIAELGDLYATAGNQEEAQKQYALVEYIGRLGRINQVLHNRDLALFYADHDRKLPEAIDLAQKELEVRHDIYTWDALAWALYKNGKLTEAADASDKALKFGTRDPLLLFHSGMIAAGLGHREQARSELQQALNINPHFHLTYADAAQQRLAALDMQPAQMGGSNANGH